MTESKPTTADARGHYTLAGWVAIVQAVLVIPQIILAVGVEFLSQHYPPLRLVLVVLSVAGAIAGVYVLYILKKLLNDRFSFHDVDIFIIVFIAINVFMFFVGIAGMIEAFELSAVIITGVIFLIYGLLSIAFGVTILRLRAA